MNWMASFLVTILTNIFFYRWYTKEIAKEVKKMEERVDKKLLFLCRKDH